MSSKIAYVKHPVTAEQKAELRGEGYKIIDARFAPKGKKVVSLDDGKAEKKKG